MYVPETVDETPHLDELTPREIVRELDKYVIGQARAKRAVAIALRNRNGSFCAGLPDHVLIELAHNLTGRQLVEVRGFVDRLRYVHTQFDSTSQFFDRDVIVRIDANLARDSHRFLDDFASAQVRIFLERTGGRERKSAAGTDTNDTIVRFDQVPGPRDQKCTLVVGNNHDGFEMTQRPVRSPILGQLDRRAAQISMKLFEFGLKTREQGE